MIEVNMSKRKQGILLNLLFYSMFFFLIGVLLYPHTVFYFKKEPFPNLMERIINQEIVIRKGSSKLINTNPLNQNATYSSSDFKVAYVNQYGRVYGNKAGRAVIKVKIKKKTYHCKVYVIDINKKDLTLKVNNKEKLILKGKIKKVTWVSKNPSIVKVNKRGEVTGLKEGNVIIYGYVRNTYVTCKVTVKK